MSNKDYTDNSDGAAIGEGRFEWNLLPSIEALVHQEVRALLEESGLSTQDLEGAVGGGSLLSRVSVSVPVDMQWGDYSTNAGLVLGPILKQSPLDIARNLHYRILESLGRSPLEKAVGSVSVVPPGYVNFEISSQWLRDLLVFVGSKSSNYGDGVTSIDCPKYAGKNIMIEYTDPNPFKVFHIGHLMPNAVGECLANLLEFCGANVKRSNYQGDVGMHVAKSIWGLFEYLREEGLTLEDLAVLDLDARMVVLGKCYALGARAYKEGSAVDDIRVINGLVYIAAQELLMETQDWTPLIDYKERLSKMEVDLDSVDPAYFAQVKEAYEMGRSWSLEYFETVYEMLGTDFDYYYFESMAGEYGYNLVLENVADKECQGVFEKDKGAVIFRGEPHGLHTRVFINSKGLPTYESKDLGLVFLKFSDFPYDLSYVVTASEQSAYFEVVLKALSKISPDLSSKTVHVSHGMMTLTEGKMSSRTGDVISVDELINQLSDASYTLMVGEDRFQDMSDDEKKSVSQQVAVSAVKYAILRQQLGKNISYDRKQSLQLSGDTGPYLQYSYVRALSLLEKASEMGVCSSDFGAGVGASDISSLGDAGLLLVRSLAHFPNVVLRSAEELSPHYLCTYLHDICGKFNSFYASTPILGEEDALRQAALVALTGTFCSTLFSGLRLLGIEPVRRM